MTSYIRDFIGDLGGKIISSDDFSPIISLSRLNTMHLPVLQEFINENNLSYLPSTVVIGRRTYTVLIDNSNDELGKELLVNKLKNRSGLSVELTDDHCYEIRVDRLGDTQLRTKAYEFIEQKTGESVGR